MHFVHRLRTIWSWLPSFRAVAETQHLPTAADQLGVVPSSLSRMVKQLEDELGVALFDRSSKSLVLNETGRALLVSVREAMRIIDDALAAALGDELRGNIGAVASSDLVHTLLVPAGAVLTVAHPALIVSSLVARHDEAAELLVRGDADVAIVVQAPPDHPELRVTELGTWARAVYGRTGRIPTGEPRVVVAGRPNEVASDGWPAGCERSIAAWAPDERTALALCMHGDLVTVAFDAVVRRSGLDAQLAPLAHLPVAARTLYLVQRRAVGRHVRTDALVAAIRQAAVDA